MTLNIYDTKEQVAKEFSEYFRDLAKGDQPIHIALSGGSTPKVIFDYLAVNFGTTIDWTKINFYWGDERCVAPSDTESNYKMTVDHLLSKIEIPATNIHRVLGENDAEGEADRYSQVLDKELPKLNDIPQFDLVMLGMGDDGHTVSIFPDSIGLWDAKENCVVATHPDSGQKRVTITGKIVNNAKAVAFLVTGAGKAEKVQEILKKEKDFASYPAHLVQPSNGELIWFLDKDAAKGIS
ncbi:6-phosphogluconolactonase [Algoriphagus ratkowskyi]|uniref:6-phosphogluconolactonase n=1 Tax=Algoriphagus ratkowskyi TaxID=57028 RepID=A0A2W7RG69_9BACT|nr:6-phosphogluconolactonase [Algoriphagus ratkowskyi]PZX54567.1 6-phosphogluconolactonase [Algoriphagus ratkowskyi]TXD76886.1 6-phosphogluconolactonase [Algoriphagus ratkowskyi]